MLLKSQSINTDSEAIFKVILIYSPLIFIFIYLHFSNQKIIKTISYGVAVSALEANSGVDLTPVAGNDPRYKFKVRVAKGHKTSNIWLTTVTSTIDPANQKLGNENTTGEIILTLVTGSSYLYETEKPLLPTVSAELVPVPAGQEKEIDPDITPLLIPSGGFLSLSASGGDATYAVIKPIGLKKLVTIGDSITAGFQSGGLRGVEQKQGYAVRLAEQMGVPFTIAEVGDAQTETGIYESFLNLSSMGQVAANYKQFKFQLDIGSKPATNPGYHNNQGVTGYTLVNMLTNKFTGNHEETQKDTTLPTDYKMVRLTPIQSAIKQRPSLITTWIGANDALGAVLDGKVIEDTNSDNPIMLEPGKLTNLTRFQEEYEWLAKQLAVIRDAYGTDIFVVDVPQVTVIPHLLEQGKIIGHTPFGHIALGGEDITREVRFTQIKLKDYENLWGLVSIIGLPYGKIITDVVDPFEKRDIRKRCKNYIENNCVEYGPPPTADDPIKVEFKLEEFIEVGEKNEIENRIESFNRKIGYVADSNSYKFGKYEIQKLFNFLDDDRMGAVFNLQNGNSRYQSFRLNKGGGHIDGDNFVVEKEVDKKIGGTFSADLVHPSDLGHAAMADKIISGINEKIRAGGFGGFKQELKGLGVDRLTDIAKGSTLMHTILCKGNIFAGKTDSECAGILGDLEPYEK